MRCTRARELRDGARRGRTRTRVAFHTESLESRRLLSVASTNPFASLPNAVTPPTATVAPTPTVPNATSAGTGTSLGAAQFGNFGGLFGFGQSIGFGAELTGVVENIYIVNLEQGVGQFQSSYGLPELDLFIGIGSTGMSVPSTTATSTSTVAPSSSTQAPTITAAPQVFSTASNSSAFSTNPTTQAAATPLAFQNAEFIVASLSAAVQAALSGTSASATTGQAHAAASTAGQASGSVAGSLVNSATTSNAIISSLSLLNNSTSQVTSSTNGFTSLIPSLLTTPLAPVPARPPQPVLNSPDSSQLRGHSATPENEEEPPVWRDLLNLPSDSWMLMPPLHLSRIGDPALERGDADRVWDSAVSSLMADQVETMAAASSERLPILGESAEGVSPVESALAVGLAVTAWVALERRTKGSDRLRQSQTPELTFDTLQ